MLFYSYMKQSSSSLKPIKYLGLAAQALAFIILTCWVVTTTMQPVAPYGDTSRDLALVVYAILLWSIPIYLKNRGHARLLSVVMWSITALVGLMIAPYIFGGLQDLLGNQCTGFFGVQGSCIDVWRIRVAVIIFPVVFIPISVTLGILMLLGDRQARRSRK
jgi:hypothetical protein